MTKKVRTISSDFLNILTWDLIQRLGSAELGILAAVGATEVEVYRLPKVALLSTGDEVETFF